MPGDGQGVVRITVCIGQYEHRSEDGTTWSRHPRELPDRHTPVVRGDARQCPFSDGSFGAAISWGMMFHLPRSEQATVFAAVSRVLEPGAPFLFTAAEIVGADDGGITGTMNGVTFHYYAVPDYRTLVAEYGFVLVDIHDDPGVSTYFLARKSR